MQTINYAETEMCWETETAESMRVEEWQPEKAAACLLCPENQADAA